MLRPGAGGALALEVRRFLHGGARDPDAARQARADKERNAPAPAVEIGGRKQMHGQGRDRDGKKAADLAGGGGGGGDQAAPMRRRPFQQIGDHAGIFPAHRKADHAAQGQQQPAGGRADGRVGGQQCTGQHGQGHHAQRGQHHAAPAVSVADPAEGDRAQRPQQIGQGKAGEGDDQRTLHAAEEHPRQHGGEIKIEREVIPFDDGRNGCDHHRSAGDAVS